MHIAIVGCGHGEVDKIYEVIAKIEADRGIKVSILLCCGDFQSVRNITDLRCMACPIKYQQMHDFHRYYSGEKTAPILTLFIGGNHEASNYLQELPYGGWVAPNIFYLGYVGVVKFGGVRIAGLSGIYKGQDYLKGRFECPPYDQGTMRSVYHYRNIDIFRLKQLKQHVDIVLSHDWPKGIQNFGNVHQLLRRKPFFRDEVERNELGSRPLFEVMDKIEPSFWFSAHMHVKFAAYVEHQPPPPPETEESVPVSDEAKPTPKITKFLALDKVLPRRQFLQIIELPTPTSEPEEPKLEYDPEWLAILRLTNHLISTNGKSCFMPGPGGNSRFDFSPTPEEILEATQAFDESILTIPVETFTQTAPIYSPEAKPQPAHPVVNPQTKEFCERLGVTDPLQEVLESRVKNPLLGIESSMGSMGSQFAMGLSSSFNSTTDYYAADSKDKEGNPDEISLDDEEEEEGRPLDELDSVKPTTTAFRSKLVLPPPKEGEGDPPGEGGGGGGDLDLLRSVMGDPNPEPEGSSGSLFYIDTAGTEEPYSKRRKELGSFRY